MMILRHPSAISRSSRAIISLTRQRTSLAATFTAIKPQTGILSSHRTFATKKSPEQPEDAEKDSSKAVEKKSIDPNNAAKSPSDGQPGKPAPGFENLYKSSGLSKAQENQPPPEDTNLEPGWTRLSPQQEKYFDGTMKRVIETLPKSLGASVQQAFDDLKKHGVPPELKDVLKDIENKKTISLSNAARIIRVSSEISRKWAEREMKSKEASQTQKKDGPSPSFFSQDKNNQNEQDNKTKNKTSNQDKEDSKTGGFKLDPTQIIVTTLATYLLWRLAGPQESTREITWQEFQGSLLSKGLVEKLQVINNGRVKVSLHRDILQQAHPDSPAVNPNFFYYFTIGSVEAFERKLDKAQDELDIASSERIPVSYTTETSTTSFLMSFAPTVLTIAFMIWLLRRMSGGAGGGSGGAGGIFGMGKSRAKKYSHETAVQVKFKDVAGADEAKVEIMEFVSFLKDPSRFEKLGAKIPRGAILSGPPGTGKTLLAKATAGESGVPFFSCSGSEFVEVFVGVGPSRVRDLFAQARKNTPCIIFIDEIDAIGKSRAKQSFGGGNDEREATLNQILTEMDGFNTSDQVVVLAGTNRPDILDAALMRPGRFDRHIAIDRPTLAGRKQIFGVYLPKIRSSEDLDFLAGRLAALTPGFSGADIANCVNEAALIAARLSADKVVISHFEQAIERVIAGLEKKSLVLSPEEKKVVAYHEAGHAICGWFFKYADPLLKVSIIPRGQGALGYALNVPGDTYLMNVHQMMDKMAMILGGRVSEELHFETVTSGASDDFNKVTRIATSMVTKYGMSEKIGYLFYEDDDNKLHKPFSEETSRNIDSEVRRIISEAYTQCKQLLTEKKKEVGMIAEELLKKEMLDRDDMIRILGKRPWDDNKEFEKYFGEKSAPPPPPHEPLMPPPSPTDTPPAFPPNSDTPGGAVMYKDS